MLKFREKQIVIRILIHHRKYVGTIFEFDETELLYKKCAQREETIINKIEMK